MKPREVACSRYSASWSSASRWPASAAWWARWSLAQGWARDQPCSGTEAVRTSTKGTLKFDEASENCQEAFPSGRPLRDLCPLPADGFSRNLERGSVNLPVEDLTNHQI